MKKTIYSIIVKGINVPIAVKEGEAVMFTNPIAHLLADDIEVIASEGEADGITTINDLNVAIFAEKQA